MTTQLAALIFDVDGTLAETEDVHRQAFNETFRAHGLDWEWDRQLYGRLLKTSGGRQRIYQYAQEIDPDLLARTDAEQWVLRLHQDKTRRYVERLRSGGIALLPGVETLLRNARQAGLRLAIATTTSPENVQMLISSTIGEEALEWFDTIITAADVVSLKPAPDAYLAALQGLNLSADACLAFEDSANGVAAAQGAAVSVIVTPGVYTRKDDFTGALRIIDNLEGVDIDTLRHWRALSSGENIV